MFRAILAALLMAAAECDGAQQARKEITFESVQAEPNLERRSQKALDFAAQSLDKARKLAADGGSMAELEELLQAVTGGVELALNSLRETGKRPSRLSRQYKRCELKSREMIRQLENLALGLGFESRAPAEEARDTMKALHEKFLQAVMTGK
jgi:hypothetical protein